MAQTPSSPAEAADKTYRGLRNFNLVMGFMHLIQGVLMIVLSNDTKYPIFTNYLKFDLSTFSLTPDPQLAYKLLFGPAVAVFLLLSARLPGPLPGPVFVRRPDVRRHVRGSARAFAAVDPPGWVGALLGALLLPWCLRGSRRATCSSSPSCSSRASSPWPTEQIKLPEKAPRTMLLRSVCIRPSDSP
jgi:hypothetical protein